MQKGSRVAVFTATKNGKLLYNSCGLVGAEKNYAHKKLNLPEFQCVLIDPDGKLKKFNIPFYYSLEGEHLDRSKDLHILRGIRDGIRKGNRLDEATADEILRNIKNLKTFECKKHCTDILIKNYEICGNLLPHCLDIFWDGFCDDVNAMDHKIKIYFINIILVTLFYQNIHDGITDDMHNVAIKVYEACHIDTAFKDEDELPTTKENMFEFHLLEDDNCVLERLLILTQEKEYKEYQQAKVTFADAEVNVYREFISNFNFDDKSNSISLKFDISEDKLSLLASDISKSIFKLKNLYKLTKFIKHSVIDPKDIVKLVFTYLMSMPLEDFNIDLIEKLIEILYYTCCATEKATNIIYNEISSWWESIRIMLIDMTCPLRSMIIAMACKSVVKIFETCIDKDDSGSPLPLKTQNGASSLAN